MKLLDKSLNREKQFRLLYILILIFITFFLFYQVKDNDFLVTWDDGAQIVNNPDVKDFDIQGVRKMFSSYYVGMYQPVTTFTFALDNKLGGLSSVWFHISNLIYHIIVVIVVFYFFRKIVNNDIHAFIIAAVFAIHPSHVETIAWLSARSNIIFTVFYLLALISYLNFINSKRKLRWYLLTFFFFIISCFSKSAAVTLPLLLIVFDFFYAKINLKSILAKLPYVLVSIVFGLVTIDARIKAEHITDLSDYYNFIDLSLITIYSIFRYFKLFLFPVEYSAFYTYPEKIDGHLPMSHYFIPVIFMILFLFIVYYTFRKSRKALFGLSFFLVTISIMLKFIPAGMQSMADRYLYLPIIGLFIMVYFLLKPLIKKRNTVAIIVVCCLFLAYFGYQTKRFSKYWLNEMSLYTQSIKIEPNAVPIKNFLGIIKKNNGETEEAMMLFNEVIDKYPQYGSVYNNRANLWKDLKEFEKAKSDYNMAILYEGETAEIFTNLGIVYAMQNEYRMALNYFDKAIFIDNEFYLAYFNRGKAFALNGFYDKALLDLNRSIDINGDFPMSYYTRGMVLYSLGKTNDACRDLQVAAKYGVKLAQKQVDKICH